MINNFKDEDFEDKIKNEEVNLLTVQVNAFVPAIPALAEIEQLREQEQAIKAGMERINCP